jgi:hypothetical protein
MKMVQSFWTAPFLLSRKESPGSRFNGGWPEKRFNYFSWALSCLQLAKFYKDVELITDGRGKDLLIDKMSLPYTSVKVRLDELDGYDPAFWALGKILAYAENNEPFLHVDHDIFIWNEFEYRVVSAEVVVQNGAGDIARDLSAFNFICENFPYLPNCFKGIDASTIGCVNAGLIGGVDHGFFKIFAREVFRFIDMNVEFIDANLSTINPETLAINYEQVFFYLLAREYKKEITCLFPEAFDNPRNIGFFHGARLNKGYVHCIGTLKDNRVTCKILEDRLRMLYPDYYYHILALMEANEI